MTIAAAHAVVDASLLFVLFISHLDFGGHEIIDLASLCHRRVHCWIALQAVRR
jgi:hypothetical protein